MKSRPVDVLTLSLGAELLALPSVRLVLGKVNVSPSVAYAMAEAALLIREAHNG